MYSSINLIFYSEKDANARSKTLSTIINSNVQFKELNSPILVFSAIKNPQNTIILVVSSKEFLTTIENIAKSSHNYQNRVFVVYSSPNLIDFFFNNFCLVDNLNKLESFISSTNTNITTQYNTSILLNKLITLELLKLDLSPKYIGFKYLTTLLTNVCTNNFYTNNYIDLFECVAYNNLSTIDTIERNIRHMLSTTWKNSEKFKTCLKSTCNKMSRPNARDILTAVITYIKTVI